MQAFLASKGVNEAHINKRAGRNLTSDEAKRYTTIFGDEHVSQVASAYGVEVEERDDEDIEPVECPRCGRMNNYDAEFCWSCRQVLDYSAAAEFEDEENRVRREVLSFISDNPEVIEKANELERMLSLMEERPELLGEASEFAEALEGNGSQDADS